MGRVVRNGRSDLWLFKHIFSRRYANGDDYSAGPQAQGRTL